MNTEDLDKDFVEQEIPIDGEEANEPVEDAQEAAEEPAEETPQTDELAEAQAEIARLKDQYLRQVAEFDNYRKRTLKEKSELILNGGEKTITALLPVLDDLQRALDNAEKSTDYDTLKSGLDLIAKKTARNTRQTRPQSHRHHQCRLRHRLSRGRGHGAHRRQQAEG